MQRRAVLVSLGSGWCGPGRAGRNPRRAARASPCSAAASAWPTRPRCRVMVEPLRQGLRERGWVEGRNLDIEWRFAEGQPRAPCRRCWPNRWPSRRTCCVAIGPRPAMLAKDATRTLPIVAVPVDDPVQMGLADSYARPGRNITGLSGAYHGLLSRRLQLLKDLVPDARRVGILMNPYTVPRADVEQGRGGRTAPARPGDRGVRGARARGLRRHVGGDGARPAGRCTDPGRCHLLPAAHAPRRLVHDSNACRRSGAAAATWTRADWRRSRATLPSCSAARRA